MTQESLSALYACHSGKVSDKWAIYLREYDRLLSPYRTRGIRLLEVGLQNGGSLEIWGRYFANAIQIVGCDIDPLCSNLRYEDPRIQVVVGDANSPAVQHQITSSGFPYDVIIDDGSHTSKDIIQFFCAYFSELSDGGVFIVEDLHCSYWEAFEGGLSRPLSSISFFTALVDVINAEHWAIKGLDARTYLDDVFQHHECAISGEILAQIHSIEFINSMCVIRKQPAKENVLGKRVVVGEIEIVTSGQRNLDGTTNGPDSLPPQSREYWAAKTKGSADKLHAAKEHIERLTSNFHELEKALKLAQEDARSATATTEALLQSRSWRLTAPLRSVYSRFMR